MHITINYLRDLEHRSILESQQAPWDQRNPKSMHRVNLTVKHGCAAYLISFLCNTEAWLITIFAVGTAATAISWLVLG